MWIILRLSQGGGNSQENGRKGDSLQHLLLMLMKLNA
jgi:hypothetical protein